MLSSRVLPRLLCIAFLAAPSAARAQDALERAVDEVLAEPLRDRRFSGAVLVRRDGKTLLRKAYGLADRELGKPNTPDTPFMIMSVSKQFTAALILRLAAQGRLHLCDRVGDRLPGWPEEWNAVTIHDLLSHSAGTDIDTTFFWLVSRFPQYWPDATEAPPPYVPRALVAPPGTKFQYSNVGYTLLTMIATAATGRPFDELMRVEVFGPLGMTHTVPERGHRVPGRARGYARTETGFELSEQETIDIVGAGDLVSTVDDLARYSEALYDDRFLPAALRKAMLTAYVSGRQGGIGYGWFLRTGKDGKPLQLHSGSGAGFRAWNVRIPESRLSIVILSNVLNDEAAFVLPLVSRIQEFTEAARSAP
ncbi:MAG: beta-lactamase family protein [Acidobacteria bacterium]|nr:beta-lactamase family protein [Acidobacteriota bacterium]